MIRGHGGEVYHLARALSLAPEEILDFSSNVSPLPPPEGLYELLSAHLSEIERLPEADSFSLREALAARFGGAPERYLPSSGTTEWIFALPRALGPRRVLILAPTYADYEDASRAAQVPVKILFAREEDLFHPPLKELTREIRPKDLVFLCNPNNPTGVFLPRASLSELIYSFPEATFVVDESYLPFAAEERESLLTLDPFPENLVVLFSFSKIYRVPGLRLGFAAAEGPLGGVLSDWQLPWAVNRLAQVAGPFLLSRKDHEERVRALVREERPRLAQGLSALGLRVFPSEANFVLTKLPENLSGERIFEELLKRKILVRVCGNFRGLSENFLRFALRSPAENDRLLQALADLL
ncbi:threonine-phosphate decarboxylase CobD [Thermosulfurimonas marina]|uniref:threonine-phosphate decarboxylase CobD n=1 Tax=Thermosulfurimonas marina TaxID=2047767 RepID=UPI00144A84A6|nr:threonine-phosphate decarboxylase CobD [Thermosulfurimonas marina]